FLFFRKKFDLLIEKCFKVLQSKTCPEISILFIVLLSDSYSNRNIDQQEYPHVYLSTRYPMTEDPNEYPNPTTRLFEMADEPLIIFDHFSKPGIRADRWPANLIPFDVLDDFSDRFKRQLTECLEILENRTCIRFRYFPDLEGKDLVLVTDYKIKPLIIKQRREYNCYASKTFFRMNLNPKFCESQLSILHLLMHVLGFDHEHIRMIRNFTVKVDPFTDKFLRDEFNQSLHHNTYDYMPYNVQSIMHILPTYPIIAHKNVHSRLRNHAKPTNSHLVHGQGPSFKDWFSNALHQFDVNNINRHYQCGEYSPLCRDYFGQENCTKFVAKKIIDEDKENRLEFAQDEIKGMDFNKHHLGNLMFSDI
uniref:Metalloendopeptidase n=1 Tax=Romanomermis culicivorax TaxID=13658 RepID=A0A915KFK0_ROMCU